MSAYHIIQELFDRDHEGIGFSSATADSWVREFVVGGRHYSVVCWKAPEEEADVVTGDVWTVSFKDNDAEDAGDPSTTVLGTGNQFKAFPAVLHILKEFVEQVDPTFIKFSAMEPSRVRLYSSLLRRFAQSYGYLLKSQTDAMGKEGQTFWLEKWKKGE